MATHDYGGICPKCEDTLFVTFVTKPYETIQGECWNCGFCYYTQEDRLTLEEVNEQRQDAEMEPLEELAEQLEI